MFQKSSTTVERKTEIAFYYRLLESCGGSQPSVLHFEFGRYTFERAPVAFSALLIFPTRRTSITKEATRLSPAGCPIPVPRYNLNRLQLTPVRGRIRQRFQRPRKWRMAEKIVLLVLTERGNLGRTDAGQTGLWGRSTITISQCRS